MNPAPPVTNIFIMLLFYNTKIQKIFGLSKFKLFYRFFSVYDIALP